MPVNFPTQITLSRLLGVPFIFYFLAQSSPFYHWIALSIFLIVALTDWLDGYLARKLNQVTALGKFLDPLVDKLLILAPLLVLVEWQTIPAWGVFLILGRELAIAGWRVNPDLAGKEVPGANVLGKAKTVLQIVASSALIAPIDESNWQFFSLLLFWLAVIVTVISGVTYVVTPFIGNRWNQDKAETPTDS